MLKFKPYIVGDSPIGPYNTKYYAIGNIGPDCREHEFIVSQNPNTKIWELSQYLFGVLESQKEFGKLSDAKEWANRQNSYLEGI
jgi:hypothetical protein